MSELTFDRPYHLALLMAGAFLIGLAVGFKEVQVAILGAVCIATAIITARGKTRRK